MKTHKRQINGITVMMIVNIPATTKKESQAAMQHLAVGLSLDGQLHGHHLHGLIENAPVLASIICDGLGINYAELHNMSKAGLLTTGRIISSINKMDAQLSYEVALFLAESGVVINEDEINLTNLIDIA